MAPRRNVTKKSASHKSSPTARNSTTNRKVESVSRSEVSDSQTQDKKFPRKRSLKAEFEGLEIPIEVTYVENAPTSPVKLRTSPRKRRPTVRTQLTGVSQDISQEQSLPASPDKSPRKRRIDKKLESSSSPQNDEIIPNLYSTHFNSTRKTDQEEVVPPQTTVYNLQLRKPTSLVDRSLPPGIFGPNNPIPPTVPIQPADRRPSPFDHPGRRLDDSPNKVQGPTPGVKRTLSGYYLDQDQDQPSPAKRPRMAEDPFQQLFLTAQESDALQALGAHDFPTQFPRKMSIIEISQFCCLLQKNNHRIANRYFSFCLSMQQRAAWPLHKLRTHYPSLYVAAQFLSDGGQNGWRDLFTLPTSRRHLVAAIMGEWINQRIFKHTAFGLDKEDVDKLEDLDREYLHYDAVVRSKERSSLLHMMFYNTTNERERRLEAVRTSVDALADELITVLYPLLPTNIFDPSQIDGDADGHARRNVTCNNFKYHVLIPHLQEIAHLALSIRLTGSDGTVVRSVPHVPRGTNYHPSSPMLCVNVEHCNEVRSKNLDDKNSELCVKMTCWPRIEAIIPHGPDIKELEFIENQTKAHQRTSPSRDKIKDWEFTWDGFEGTLWPELPDELQRDNIRSMDFDAEEDDAYDDDGDNDVQPTTKRPKKRGPYMTIYPRLCPSTVYCEWTPKSNLHTPSRPLQSLHDAVAEARAEKGILTKLEDTYISLHNHLAIYGPGYQWLLAGAGLAYLLKRSSIIPNLLPSVIKTKTTSLGIDMKELILTHLLGAPPSPSITTTNSESDLNPFFLLSALKPYLDSPASLRAMTSTELTAHLRAATAHYLHDIIGPFAGISFSIPDAVRQLLGIRSDLNRRGPAITLLTGQKRETVHRIMAVTTGDGGRVGMGYRTITGRGGE